MLTTMTIVIVTLSAIIYSGRRSRTIAIANSLTDAETSLTLSAQELNRKADEIYDALDDNYKSPGGRQHYMPYLLHSQNVKAFADSMFALLDSLAVLADSGNNTALPLGTDDTLGRRIAETYGAMLAETGGAVRDRADSEEAMGYRAVKVPGRSIVFWGEGNPAIQWMELARIRLAITRAENFHLARLYSQSSERCVPDFEPAFAHAFKKHSILFLGDRGEVSVLPLNTHWLHDTKGSIKEVKIYGKSMPMHDDTVFRYRYTATGSGYKTIKGNMVTENANGMEQFDFRTGYFVLPHDVRVTVDEELSTIPGEELHLSIQTLGVAPEDIKVTSSLGNITKAADHYIFVASEPCQATVRVSARKQDGNWRVIATAPCLVRPTQK
jgi:hypothetical protein